VRGELARADLFVLPSKTEGLPRVIIEAMSVALPCLGTTVGGTPELLPAENMVPAGDAAVLAAKITEVVSTPGRMNVMSVWSVQMAPRYAASVLTQRRTALYRHLRERTQNAVAGNRPDQGRLRTGHDHSVEATPLAGGQVLRQQQPSRMTGASVDSDMFYTVLSRGILGVQSNLPNLRWSFGRNAPPATQAEFAGCAVRLQVRVEPSSAFAALDQQRKEQRWGKYHFLSGLPAGRLAFYHRPFLLGSKLYLEAAGLAGDQPRIRVNRNYYRFIHFRFMNLHSLGFVLTDLAALLLLQRQLAPLHCSAFRQGERTVIVFAPSYTGKTLTTMMACIERGADFIAEDLAITDGRQVFGLPWTSTFRYYSKVDARWLARTANRATKVLPFLDLLPITRSKRITEYVSKDRICHQATATHIAILERGAPCVSRVSPDIAFRKLLNLNRSEFNYQRSLVNNAYEFFNPELDVTAACATEQTILRTLVAGVSECFVVSCEDPTQYADLILSRL
jgi:hypothetical protein